MWKMIKVEVYKNACNNYMGWCVVCQDFTRPNTEPDARDYNCPVCKDTTSVSGAEEALLDSFFEVK